MKRKSAKLILFIVLILLSAMFYSSCALSDYCLVFSRDPYCLIHEVNGNDVPIMYVSNKGNDDYLGTKEKPFYTIIEALKTAKTLYPNGIEIRIATGNYEINSQKGETIVIDRKNYSLRGGFSEDFNIFDPNEYPTMIRDTAITGAISIVIQLGNSEDIQLDENTVIEGLQILGGHGSGSCGIYITKAGKPVIRNNIIDGGDASANVGIYNHRSSPHIIGNNIRGGRGILSVGIVNRVYSIGSYLSNYNFNSKLKKNIKKVFPDIAGSIDNYKPKQNNKPKEKRGNFFKYAKLP
ncbi:MAG: DUF1565 domain-containing protein, partial [Spirochaetota bacterium]